MFSKAKKKGLKREDFLFENGWFQTIIKQPQQLHMQQFQISDCEECEIFLFDSSAAVYIDDCKYCYVFVGPCQSSIFVRNCHYMTIIGMTQQFRVRDSTNCKVCLWCQSQPIIQSSYSLSFDCFRGPYYPQLHQQIKQSRLNLWNNNWFDIYDFTPNKFPRNQPNHTLQTLIQQEKAQQKLKEIGLKSISNICPVSTGDTSTPFSVIMIYPVPQKWKCTLICIHSRVMMCPPELSWQQGGQACLFIKIKKQEGTIWVKETGGRLADKDSQLQIIQKQVFFPFRDEH